MALEAGAICGFATTGPAGGGDDPVVGELLALYVDRGCWGRGVGRRLITEARGRLLGRGFTNAILWVLAGNERAERFYRADGWAPDGARRREVIWGVAAEEVRSAVTWDEYVRRLLPSRRFVNRRARPADALTELAASRLVARGRPRALST